MIAKTLLKFAASTATASTAAKIVKQLAPQDTRKQKIYSSIAAACTSAIVYRAVEREVDIQWEETKESIAIIKDLHAQSKSNSK